MNQTNWNAYFTGEKLYGDDFTLEEIKQWYAEEEEAYANLAKLHGEEEEYIYHELNKYYAYKKLKGLTFRNALGFGSAFGYEFLPIIGQIENITIIEPSEKLKSDLIGNIKPNYIKPDITGKIPFESNSFQLITCFGVLHHICNVTFVLNELIRVLDSGGYLIIREPIISMGDWRFPRIGLTKNERGIPVSVFLKIFKENKVDIVSKNYILTLSYHFSKFYYKFFKKSIYMNKGYIIFDKYLSLLTKWNYHYHAQKPWQRIAPNAIMFVIRKK